MHLKYLLLPVIFSVVLSGCAAEASSAAEETSELQSVSSEEAGASDEDTETMEGVSRELFAMDTYMVVTAYGERAEDAVTAAVNEIQRLDALLSTGSEDSEISLLNESGGGTVSDDTESLIEKALEVYSSTDGAFDLSVYPVMKLWGFADDSFAVPDQEELAETLNLVDASQITLDTGAHTVSFGTEGMEIDLGGIAKGYTSARVAEIFKAYGIESGLLNLGGNVQAVGTKQDGSSWKVAVQSPEEDGYLGILQIEDRAVITSGGYERYFEEDGELYHHIIDPDTGYPAENGIVSSTIVSSDGTLADALSTSLYIMGLEDAIEFWQESGEDFDFILEEEDGMLYVTEGISDSFSSDMELTVISKE